MITYSQTPNVVFPKNCGPNLSIDETSLSKNELFTIVTNKDSHGGKSALVAMLYGTKASEIVAVLEESLPAWRHLKVKRLRAIYPQLRWSRSGTRSPMPS